jgi:hypothetical protein
VGEPLGLVSEGTRRLAVKVMTEAPAVAKKKPEKFVKDFESKPIAFQVRGVPDYKAAIEKLAKFDGKSVSSLADHALRVYARQINFPDPIPTR